MFNRGRVSNAGLAPPTHTSGVHNQANFDTAPAAMCLGIFQPSIKNSSAPGMMQQGYFSFPGIIPPASSNDTPTELMKLADRKNWAIARMANAKREYQAAEMKLKALEIEIAKYGTRSQHSE